MIPVPERMAHLKVDARGYPVPWGVFVDSDGLPHFAVNVEETRHRCLAEDRCGICGHKLFRGRWFVGGGLSAFHRDGAFIDPPMHSECAHFALRVCPYLAAPRYTKEIGAEKIKRAKDRDMMILLDPTLIPGRPAGDMFVAIMARKQLVFENFNVKPIRPYSVVEFWRHGVQVNEREGQATVAQALSDYDAGPRS